MEHSIVETIRELCKKKGTNFAKLERENGLSIGQIRRWDNQTPKVSVINKIAKHLNVHIEYLIGSEVSTIDNQMTDDMYEVMEKMQGMTREQQKQLRDIVNVLSRK